MSADTREPQAEALRATEAPTEVQLADVHPPDPAYVDVSDGRPARKPIIPAHLREGDGSAGLARGILRHLRHQSIRHGHAGAYHAVRSPRYLTLLLPGRSSGCSASAAGSCPGGMPPTSTGSSTRPPLTAC
jgi:hypothetical protein